MTTQPTVPCAPLPTIDPLAIRLVIRSTVNAIRRHPLAVEVTWWLDRLETLELIGAMSHAELAEVKRDAATWVAAARQRAALGPEPEPGRDEPAAAAR